MTGKAGDIVPTGVEAQRRRLTDAEACAGAKPEPFTPREWRAMRRATARYARDLGIPDTIRLPRPT
ncbi:hypothetical protein [Gemmatimonas sp.]